MPNGPIQIRLGNVKLNNVDHQSSVSIGTTCYANRNVCAKKNQGFGQQLADRVARVCTVHWTQDDDAADVVSYKANR